MFGIKILTKKGMIKLQDEANNKAIAELVELLRKKDKIFLEPLTIVGDNQVISNCVFLNIKGSALSAIPEAELVEK